MEDKSSKMTVLPNKEAIGTLGACATLVRQAKEQEKWLYDPGGKQWYDPDQFAHVFGQHILYKEEAWFRQVQIKDPVEAIENGWKRVQELQRSIMMLTGKVVVYSKKKWK